MQSRAPTIAREEVDEQDSESDPVVLETTSDSREDKKSLDEIIDTYAE